LKRTVNGEVVKLEDIFKIQVTTSKDAFFPLAKNRLRQEVAVATDGLLNVSTEAAQIRRAAIEGEPEFIYVDFNKDRTVVNKAARLIYAVTHALYVSFFFYFAPFFSIIISYFFIDGINGT